MRISKIGAWLRRDRFNLLVAAGFLVVNLILILNHEPWTDEANPYLVAREFSFNNAWEVLKGEPHPILWTLILAPFAKLGLPLVTSHLISLVIVTLAVYLTLRFAPFPRWTKLLVVASAAFLYFYPVITRDYSLIPLAAVLVCMAYRARFEHPLRYSLAIAFLVQTHYLANGLAAGLFVVFLFEMVRRVRKTLLIAALMIVAVAVFLNILCAIGPMQEQIIIQYTLAGEGMGRSFFGYFSSVNLSVFQIPIAVFESSLILTLFYLLLKYRRQLVYLLVAVVTNWVVLTFIYNMTGNVQKDAINLIMILVALWTAHDEVPKDILKRFQRKIQRLDLFRLVRRMGAVPVLLVALSFGLSIPGTVSAAMCDLSREFSSSATIARYINENLPPGSVIVVPDYALTASLSPLLLSLTEERVLWDAATQMQPRYIDYTLPSHVERIAYGPVEALDRLRQDLGEDEMHMHIFFLTDKKVPMGWTWLARFEMAACPTFGSNIPLLNLYAVR